MKTIVNLDGLHPILQELIVSFLREGDVNTPTLLFSKRLLKENIDYFMSRMAVDKIFFPVKTNNQPDVLKFLSAQGVCFEIASLGELKRLKDLAVRPDNIIFGNPVKINSHIEFAAQMGVNTFSIDAESELIKIKQHVNNANIYLRLDVSNDGAKWELSEKFGCNVAEALKLFHKTAELGMHPAGVSFHVGWNNANIETWEQAVLKCHEVISMCRDDNIALDFINIGGGFPAHLNDQYTVLDSIADTINPLLNKIKAEFNMEVYAEPGSFFTTNAGVVIAKVINVIKRNKRDWVYLNTGINQGFNWIMGGLEYVIFSPQKTRSPLAEYVVCGPTCDSHDLFSQSTLLNSALKMDDYLLIYPAGSYISSSKEYNGFDYPVTKVI